MSVALTWAGVAVLGGLGALARAYLGGAVLRRAGAAFPWGTAAVNALGAFLAGVAAGAGLDGRDRTLLVVGVLGSFTTLSTWALEARGLASCGRRRAAAIHLGGGIAVGLIAAGAGWWVATRA